MAKSATQMAPSFGSILDKPANEIERPPLLPKGYYVCIVTGQPKIDKSSQKQTEFIDFQLKVIAPLEKDGIIQADEQELEEFGDVKDHILHATFYLTEKAGFRAREFLEHCGIDTSQGQSLRQLIAEAVGQSVVARVTHEPWQSGDGFSARVQNTAPVEDESAD